jgi:hypothetical protein
VLAPIGSDAGERGGAARQRGASFGFGIATPRAERPAVLMVLGRRERLGPPATFNIDTGAGYVSPREGDYISARAEPQALGVSVVLIRVPELCVALPLDSVSSSFRDESQPNIWRYPPRARGNTFPPITSFNSH